MQSSGLAFECVGTCGQILSRGYPHGYSNSERTEWNIRVESDRYISLVFKDFDVFEKPLQECKKDFVEVLDVDLIKELTSFGRYVIGKWLLLHSKRRGGVFRWYSFVILRDSPYFSSFDEACHKVVHTY